MNNDTIKKYWEELEFKSGSSLCDYNYIGHPHIRNFYNNLKLKTINCYINPFQFRYDINEWVHSSKHNNVDISSFIRKDIIRNVYDCIDEATFRYRHKRLRILRGELGYLNNSYFYTGHDEQQVHIEKETPYVKYIDSYTGKYFDLDEDDWVFISAPFYGTGSMSDKFEGILNQADLLNIPVVIDCSLYPVSRDINIDFSRPCIKEAIFTTRKLIGPAQIEVGIRYSNYDQTTDLGSRKEHGLSPIRLINTKSYFLTEIEMVLATQILKKFSTDYMYDECRHFQKEICDDFNLTPTNCVNICIAPNEEPWLSDWDAPQAYLKVDISKALELKLKGEYILNEK
jgi:hypothetical protein